MRHVSVILTLFLMIVSWDTNAQNKRVLLLESFTNTGCENCAQQNPEFEALLSANVDKVAVIQYHVNWPSDTDPMYMHNPTDNEARTGFYGVTGIPHLIIDGNHFSGAPNQLSQDIIDQLLTIESPIEMQLDYKSNEGGSSFLAHVTGRSAIIANDLKLYIGIIEKEIHFNSSPGQNGECNFYHVMRALLPDASGQTIEHLDVNETFDYTFDCVLDNPNLLSHLDVIAWLQSANSNRAVLQACKANYYGFDEADHYTICIYPNPTTGMVYITSPSLQKVSVFNMIGQCVFKDDCHDLLPLNLKDFGTGLFVIKVGSHIQKVNVL